MPSVRRYIWDDETEQKLIETVDSIRAEFPKMQSNDVFGIAAGRMKRRGFAPTPSACQCRYSKIIVRESEPEEPKTAPAEPRGLASDGDVVALLKTIVGQCSSLRFRVDDEHQKQDRRLRHIEKQLAVLLRELCGESEAPVSGRNGVHHGES